MYIDSNVAISSPIYVVPSNLMWAQSLYPDSDLSTILYNIPKNSVSISAKIGDQTSDTTHFHNAINTRNVNAESINVPSEKSQLLDTADGLFSEESFEAVKRTVYNDIHSASIAQGQNIADSTIMTLLG